MIRNLLATTALITLAATAGYAQQQPAPTDTQTTQPEAPVVKADGYLATNIIGESVYNGSGDTAENIGDVNDIVLDKEGKTEAVIVGVGGFLGIGERNVAVEWAKMSWAEANGDRWIVYPATKEQLEALPEFDRRPYDPAPAPVASTEPGATAPATTEDMAAAPTTEPAAPTTEPAPPATTDQQTAQTEQPAATEEPAAPAPADQQAAEKSAEQPADTTTTAAIDKSTLTEVPADKLTTEQDLMDTTVYGANDESIGEISDVVMSQDGKVDAVVVDVGGFLGMGEKKVAIAFDKLQFMADKDGKKYVYTPFTKEQLDKQTAYDESTFAEKRNEQLLIVQ
jgi:sporulation protein YlmC with PRC-barrel domain